MKTLSFLITVYYLEFLTPKTMKILGNTKSKRYKDKKVENMPHLENTELLVLVHCNIADNYF